MTTPPQKIYAALIAIMNDVGAIGKFQKNQQQGFNFRGIDTIYNELHGILAKHGVVTVPLAGQPTTEERATKTGGVLRFTSVPMTYRFMADDGSFVEATVIGEGMDSADKSTNKAMAIAHKYALLQMFLIPTEDMPDPDSETHEVAPKPKQEPPKTAFTDKPNLKKLVEELAKAGITPDEALQTLKYKKGEDGLPTVPEKATDLLACKDETAAKILEVFGYLADGVVEWRVMKKE